MNTNCSNSAATQQAADGRQAGPFALDSFTLALADLADAPPFIAALGLNADIRADRIAIRAQGNAHVWATLVPGPAKRLCGISFAAYPSDVERIGRAARDHGRAVTLGDGAVSIIGPDGIEIGIIGRDRATFPARTSAGNPLIWPSAPRHDDAGQAVPASLSHIAIFVTDVDRALDFYVGALGLRLSDRSGDALAFLHAPHGSDHHVLALVKSDGPGLHHHSWEMSSIDAIGLRAAEAARLGYDRGWGLGRHVLGSNFFHYVRDPWGSHAELTTGLEFIPAGEGWIAGDHAGDDAFYAWGPPPPAGFIDNPELSHRARPSVAA